MPFLTKLDFSSNRQVKQHKETITVLSGGTSFGVPFSALTTGPNLLTSGISQTYSLITSSFSGNSGTTNYSWYDSRMSLGANTLSALTPSNSATTQNTGQVYTASSTTIIDGNIVSLGYTGVSYNITVTGMTDLGGGNYSGSVLTGTLDILSANTLDFTGRTIWVDVSGITRTNDLIVTKNPQIGYVLTCVDNEGKVSWQPSSGATSGGTSGTTPYKFDTNATAILPISGSNTSSGLYSIVNGGKANTASNCYSTVGGGLCNTASSLYSYDTIGGGFSNTSSGVYGHNVIGGGNTNLSCNSINSTISGGRMNKNCDSIASTISGGYNNYASTSSSYVTIGGGKCNTVSSSYSTIAGGSGNTASNCHSFIGGGQGNTASGYYSVIGGGQYNTTIEEHSTIGGGQCNTVNTPWSTVSGGYCNKANASYTNILGGERNLSCCIYATVLGGCGNVAAGQSSLVFGNLSRANSLGTIVLGNNITGTTSNTTYVDNLNIKSVGAGPGVTDLGVDAGGNVVDQASDIKLKENINTIENALNKVLSLRGVTYNWKDKEKGGVALKIGFIAQEVSSKVPELAYYNPNGDYMGVHYKDVTALLVEAIKELASGKTTSNNTHLETQTILAEDNNIELNYNGTKESAIGGGITVIDGISKGKPSLIVIDSDGNWITNNDLKPKDLTIPKYTPTSSTDNNGKYGNITMDDNFLYIKTNVWKRINMEEF